jgi:hypothetical protein
MKLPGIALNGWVPNVIKYVAAGGESALAGESGQAAMQRTRRLLRIVIVSLSDGREDHPIGALDAAESGIRIHRHFKSFMDDASAPRGESGAGDAA